jgi:hypothetical protein
MIGDTIKERTTYGANWWLIWELVLVLLLEERTTGGRGYNRGFGHKREERAMLWADSRVSSLVATNTITTALLHLVLQSQACSP